MRNFIILLAIISFVLRANAQKQALSYYLPNQNFDKNIPSPEQFLGWQIGEWHVSHDQVIAYMRELDRLSDRITIQEYGKTYEQRPLMVLFITHPDNQLRMTEIKEAHQRLSDASHSDELKTADMPIVLYQGYSIHGNEPSGTNAAMLMAYYYASVQSAEMERTLRNSVILFDPSFNPDGLQRFSTWVNQHKSKNMNGDNAGREYNEVWPGGRTNHYYFDLNRDWLVSQMPESQG
ncbi:MAG: M14 family zinc carboxypeptidase, partial [Saprospiraceae bacterium]